MGSFNQIVFFVLNFPLKNFNYTFLCIAHRFPLFRPYCNKLLFFFFFGQIYFTSAFSNVTMLCARGVFVTYPKKELLSCLLRYVMMVCSQMKTITQRQVPAKELIKTCETRSQTTLSHSSLLAKMI